MSGWNTPNIHQGLDTEQRHEKLKNLEIFKTHFKRENQDYWLVALTFFENRNT